MKEDDVSIQVKNLGKVFSKKPNFLKPSFWVHYFSKNKNSLMADEFWALRNVNFEVKKGECLGIIGRNGAGKSTILKILAKITEPTSGSYVCKGKLGALVEVGAGFHPEMTGRENVYLNAAVLGMGREEVDKKFKSIVDFAELWDFIDTPIKKYSSGMLVRLGFATAIHINPDILLVDEVLAVGDENFRIKCFNKIHDLQDKGVSIILVTHQMYLIRRYCNKVIFLKKGRVDFIGDKEKAIDLYMKEGFKPEVDNSSNGVKILSKKMLDNNGKEKRIFKTGEDIFVEVELDFLKKMQEININFYLQNVGFSGGGISRFDMYSGRKVIYGKKKINFKIGKNPFNRGNFILGFYISDNKNKVIINKDAFLVFEVKGKIAAPVRIPFSMKIN